MHSRELDVVIVGGGPAGLSAALVLGRARRSVLVLDADAPANAVSHAVNGFLSRDGTPPGELRAVSRDQLAPYSTVEVRTDTVEAAGRLDDGRFEVRTLGGAAVAARRVLLAHGMRYERPPVAGMAEAWGERLLHCPYCHGWEVRDQPVGVYGNGPGAVRQALLLTTLSADVALLRDDDCDVDEEARQRLDRAQVALHKGAVARVARDGEDLRIEFADGRSLLRHALFIQPTLRLASDIGPSLGAEVTETGAIRTEEYGSTSVPGVYAAGDAGGALQSVVVAAGSGATAAYALHFDLAQEDTRAGGVTAATGRRAPRVRS